MASSSSSTAATALLQAPSNPHIDTDDDPDDEGGFPVSARGSTEYRDRSESLMDKLQRSPVARKTLGITLLLFVVFLWTASNFLASSIFADDTYSKPFFVTYLDTSVFALALIPTTLFRQFRKGRSNQNGLQWGKDASDYIAVPSDRYDETPLSGSRETDEETEIERLDDEALAGSGKQALLAGDRQSVASSTSSGKLNFRDTARLSFQFSMVWFIANYFTIACLKYTTVASATILTSTSSIWTLVIGAVLSVESFSFKKLFCVLCSLAGVIIIYSVDLRGDKDDAERGKFPLKTPQELSIGDGMAFLSAVCYGIYATMMKKKIGDESKVDMMHFFGMVGVFNILLLWPGFLILHFTGAETFELPPDGKVWAIVIINAFSSFISDICWAFAMLLTSPLVVTIGLSLNIPLALFGQMILQDQYSTPSYWIGAVVVLLSFVIINIGQSNDEHEAGHGAVPAQSNTVIEQRQRSKSRNRERRRGSSEEGLGIVLASHVDK